METPGSSADISMDSNLDFLFKLSQNQNNVSEINSMDSDANPTDSEASSSLKFKRKRQSITLQTKMSVIRESEVEGKTILDLVAQFNLGRTTIFGILKGKKKIQEAFESGKHGRSIIKSLRYKDLDDGILLWLNIAKEAGMAVDGKLLIVSFLNYSIVDFEKFLPLKLGGSLTIFSQLQKKFVVFSKKLNYLPKL